MDKQLNFKKIDNTDQKFINWSGINLLNQCMIVPVKNDMTPEYLEELIHKNSLQGKIWRYQYNELLNIYRNTSNMISDFYDANEEYTKRDLQMINNVNYSNNKTIKKYSNLDLLSTLQKYRNDHSIITNEELIAESIYIKNLIVISTLQQVILGRQLINLLTISEKILYTMLSEHYSIEINQSNLDTITDKETLVIVLTIKELQSSKNDVYIHKFDLSKNSRVFFFEAGTLKPCHKSKKTIPLKIIPPKNVTNDCCICFDKIDQKIALVSCGHTSVCENCIVDINKCPICMSSFTQHVKIII